MKELWDLYDQNRAILNRTHVRGVPLAQGEYHLVVDIWTISSAGRILITQRHPDKPLGRFWECTGGSVIAGEDSLTGAIRELEEEIGITAAPNELIFIHSIRLNDRFVDTYIIKKDIKISDLALQPEEVIGAQLVTISELIHMWENGMITPRERLALYLDKLSQFVAGQAGCVKSNSHEFIR